MAYTHILDSYTRCVTLTPNDNEDIFATTAANANGPLLYARMLVAVTAGTVAAITTGGDLVNYTLAAGDQVDWVGIRRVLATGTTATVQGVY